MRASLVLVLSIASSSSFACTLSFDLPATTDAAGRDGGASGCPGCVDMAGLCQRGDAVAACGAGGVTCARCDPPTSACTSGTCTVAEPVREVSLSSSHTCATFGAGRARCWGCGRYGGLDGMSADGMSDDVELPGTWDAIAAGGGYLEATCGITASAHGLRCWGSTSDGQLGIGTPVAGQAPPTDVAAGRMFLEIGLGMQYGCAIEDGAAGTRPLYCWGDPNFGRLGLREGIATSAPDMALRGCARWRGLAAARYHSCALCEDDGALWCWGENTHGAVARDPTTTPIAWEPVPVGTGFTDVAVALHHTCAVRADGHLIGWGNGAAGQLVAGTTMSTFLLIDIGGDEDGWTDVAVAAADPESCGPAGLTCGIQRGALYCWGENCHAQLGQGDVDPRSTRVRVNVGVVDEDDWARVWAGSEQVCAAKTSGALYCWGRNNTQQVVSARIAMFRTPITRPVHVPFD